jgi:hypothetical protein
MIPWSFFFPTTARTLWRERKGGEGDTVLYLFLWAAVIFVFFSFSDSKLIPYILPVLPAAALLIGKTFSLLFEGEAREMRTELWSAGIFLSILGTAIILYPHVAGIPKIGAKEAGVIGGIVIFEGFLIMTVLRKSKTAVLFATLFSLSCILGICVSLLAMEDVSEWKSSKQLGLIMRAQAGKDALVASYEIYQQGLSFYSGRRVILIDNKSELEFGSLQGDHAAWFMDTPRFRTLWDSARPVYVMLKQHDMQGFRASMNTPVRIVGQSADMLLVCNR